jgi:hypothetical protein
MLFSIHKRVNARPYRSVFTGVKKMQQWDYFFGGLGYRWASVKGSGAYLTLPCLTSYVQMLYVYIYTRFVLFRSFLMFNGCI